MSKKHLIQVFILLNGWAWAAAPALERCGPFEMTIVDLGAKGRNVSRSPVEDPIDAPDETFAASAEKGNVLLSDAPFFYIPGFPSGFEWVMSVGDSYLVKQNTLLEIKGYLESLEGVKLPKDFLDADRIDGYMTAFRNMSARKFIGTKFGPALGEDPDVLKALKRAFPGEVNKELRQKIVEGMEKRASVPYGEKYFSRRSFLSSEAVKKTFGEAAILACMAFGYASDAYTHKDEIVRDSGPQMAARSLQSSVIDYLASEAFKLKKNGKEPSGAEIMLAKGEITCKLSLSKGYGLTTSRCGEVVQRDPVVRAGTKPENLFVQLGTQLYSAKCVLPGGKQIDLSLSEPLDFDDLLRKSDFDPKKPVEKYLADNLASLTSQDRKGVMAARNLCDEEIRRLERGAPETEIKKIGALPHVRNRSLATAKREPLETARGMRGSRRHPGH